MNLSPYLLQENECGFCTDFAYESQIPKAFVMRTETMQLLQNGNPNI